MNIPLLRRIQKCLDKNPALFEMSDWQTEVECGTAYCIAGWACKLSGKEVNFDVHYTEAGPLPDVQVRAAKLLDLSYGQSLRLFGKMCWPAQFQRNYHRSEDSAPDQRNDFRLSGENAKLGIQRIEHFIQTGGAE